MTVTPVRTRTGTSGDQGDTDEEPVTAELARPVWTPRTRGRHRRPRPRKVLFAAGGLALAAGALSLLRLSPDSGVAGLGTAEAEPRIDPTADATHAAASGAPAPEATPTAPAAMGGSTASSTPTPSPATPTVSPTSPVLTPSGPYATPTPAAPRTAPPAPAPPAPGPAPVTTAPQPTAPTPISTTDSPAPRPDRPDLCVPVIGLCVDPLSAPR